MTLALHPGIWRRHGSRCPKERALKLIIWDFDGTLGYRGTGPKAQSKWTGAMMEMLADELPGLTPNRDALRRCLQSGYPWHTPEIAHPEIRSAQDWWDRFHPTAERALVAAGVPPERVSDLSLRFRYVYTGLRHWRLFDDTVPVLERLTQLGWTHVALSNHVPELGEIVSHLGLAPHLDAVYNSAETGYEKPHPRALEIVRDDYADADPLWMVGDSLSADVGGAKQAGLPAILVRHPEPDAPELAQVQHSVADLWGVVDLLEAF
jgi:putative hydrolase of the HAD superfamily